MVLCRRIRRGQLLGRFGGEVLEEEAVDELEGAALADHQDAVDGMVQEGGVAPGRDAGSGEQVAEGQVPDAEFAAFR